MSVHLVASGDFNHNLHVLPGHMPPVPPPTIGQSAITAGPVCTSGTPSSCGTLVLSCVLPVLLVASSIPAMMVKRNIEYNTYIKKRNKQKCQLKRELSGNISDTGNLVTLDTDLTASAFVRTSVRNKPARGSTNPYATSHPEPRLTLSLSDTSVLQLGFSSFRDSVLSQLNGRLQDKGIASRSSPTLGVSAWPTQHNSCEAFDAPSSAMVIGAADLVAENKHVPCAIQETFAPDEPSKNDALHIKISSETPSNTDHRDLELHLGPCSGSLPSSQCAASIGLPEEALIYLGPLGLPSSQMSSYDQYNLECDQPVIGSLVQLDPVQAMEPSASSPNSSIMKFSSRLQADQTHDTPKCPVVINWPTHRQSDPGDLWDECDDSIFSFGASVTGADVRRNLSSTAESLLLRDTGELWDTEDEKWLADVEQVTALSTYASLAIASLEFEMVDAPPMLTAHTDLISDLMGADLQGSFAGLDTHSHSATGLAVSTASIPQVYSPSLASEDRSFDLERNANYDIGEPIMDVRVHKSLFSFSGSFISNEKELPPQTSLATLASHASSLWPVKKPSVRMSFSTLTRTSTFCESSYSDSMSFASVVDAQIVNHRRSFVKASGMNRAYGNLGYGVRRGQWDTPLSQTIANHFQIGINPGAQNHLRTEKHGYTNDKTQRHSLCVDVEQVQSVNSTSTITSTGFCGHESGAALIVGHPGASNQPHGARQVDKLISLEPRSYAQADRISIRRKENQLWSRDGYTSSFHYYGAKERRLASTGHCH